jgi:hypothetical protein
VSSVVATWRAMSAMMGLILVLSSSAPMASAATTASAAILLPTGQSCYPSIMSHPDNIVLSCADGNEYLGYLKWFRWGLISAAGTGMFMQNTCVPDCAGGPIVSKGAVAVTASTPTIVGGHRIYTRLKMTMATTRSYALLAWDGRTGPFAGWDWLTPNFAPAASATGLVFDAKSMHLDGTPPIPDAPDIIMNAVQSEVIIALTSRLGRPRVFSSKICRGTLPVTVAQWQDLSIVFEGGISVRYYYNYLGWADAQSPHPRLPPSAADLWPKLTTTLGLSVGMTVFEARKIDPLLRGNVREGFMDGRMSIYAASPLIKRPSTSTSQYVISQIGAAGGNC